MYASPANASYAAAVAGDSPAGYWRLGESSGTVAADETANANSGSYLNGAGLGTPGAVADGNTATTLNGASSYVRASNAASLNPTSSITLEAWVKPKAGTFGSSKPVIAKGYTTWAAPYYQYSLTLYDAGASPKYVEFGVAVGGTRVSVAATNAGWRSDVWNHLAATYDGATMRLYVNGTQVASQAQTGSLSTYATPVAFGCSEHRDKNSTNCLAGELDEPAVYGVALSAAQIQAHYAQVRPPGAPAPTAAPAISGSTMQGQTLTASNGAWTASPTGYAYQWKRCNAAGSSCTDIPGATGSTRTLTADDADFRMRVAVTASNASGGSSEVSPATAVVVGPPTNTSPPTITGTTKETWTLTVNPGSWTGNPTFGYQWRRCNSAGAECIDIPGETGTTYTLKPSEKSRKFTVNVTATNSHSSTAAGSSTSSKVLALTTVPAPVSVVQCGLSIPLDGQYVDAVRWNCNGPFWYVEFQNRYLTGDWHSLYWTCKPYLMYPWNSCGQDGFLAHASGKLLSFRKELEMIAGESAAIAGGAGSMGTPQGCGEGSPPGVPSGTQPCFRYGRSATGVPPEQVRGDCGNQTHAIDPSSCLGDPVNGSSGGFRDANVDLALDGVGLDFTAVRTYNSEDPSSGAFGRGWSFSYAPRLEFETGGNIRLRAEDGQEVRFLYSSSTGSYSKSIGVRSSLSQAAGEYELVNRDQVVYRFDSSGRLSSMRERNSRQLTFAYDANGLTAITDTVGRTIDVVSNVDGLITRIELPDGRYTSYTYVDGQLRSVRDVRGGTTTYTYTPEGWLKTIVDQNGRTVVTNTYADFGRIVEQTDALGEDTLFDWDPATSTLSTTDARGNVWQDVYSGNQLVKRIDPLGGTTEYSYDAESNMTSVKSPRGHTTTFTYDSRGNLLTATAPAPLGYQRSFTYDPTNNPLTATDGLGRTTTLGYDTRGNLTALTLPDPDGAGPQAAPGVGIARDPVTGQPVSVTDPRSKTTLLGYDASLRVDSITSPLGNELTLAYSAAGDVTSAVDPRGNVAGANAADYRWTYTYDGEGRVLTATDPLGNTTTFAYDAVGNLITRTDANNHVVEYAYDAANRLISVTAPDSTVTAYGYDAIGNLTSRTDAKNHTTQYTYDVANRLQTVVTPSGGLWSYEHDANGNLTKVTDANGNATSTVGDGVSTFSYDVLDRLTGIDYSDATPDVQYGYDAAGRRTSMTDGAGTVSYSYDGLGRLTELTRGADTFAYAYDAAGNVVSRTYPEEGAAAYGYDDDGRLASVSKSGATTSYSYDAAGQLTQMLLPSANGYVETRAYDRAGRVASLEHARAGVPLASAAYAYDAVGNPTAVTTQSGVTTYGYDALDRLVDVCFAASCPGAADPFLRYAYDAVGNRTTETRPSGVTSYSYDADDRLLSASGPGATTTYGFDANGNQTQAGARTFAYDLANRTSSTTLAGATTNYGYDGDGVRLSATEGSSSTSFLWDVNFGLPQLALERENGATVRSHLHGRGPVSFMAGGQTSYLHRDALGSVTNVTSSSGGAQWTYAYEPFGAARVETQHDPSAAASPLRFAGEYLDPSGLYHLRARQYDTETGRFTTVDPLPAVLTRWYRSTYVYADNRPATLIDPSGMGPVWPDETPVESCDGWARGLRCAWDSVGATVRAFATGDGNCWGSLVSYWATGSSVLAGGRLAQVAARSKPYGLVEEVLHPHSVIQIGVAKGGVLGGGFLITALDQSAKCGR